MCDTSQAMHRKQFLSYPNHTQDSAPPKGWGESQTKHAHQCGTSICVQQAYVFNMGSYRKHKVERFIDRFDAVSTYSTDALCEKIRAKPKPRDSLCYFSHRSRRVDAQPDKIVIRNRIVFIGEVAAAPVMFVS